MAAATEGPAVCSSKRPSMSSDSGPAPTGVPSRETLAAGSSVDPSSPIPPLLRPPPPPPPSQSGPLPALFSLSGVASTAASPNSSRGTSRSRGPAAGGALPDAAVPGRRSFPDKLARAGMDSGSGSELGRGRGGADAFPPSPSKEALAPAARPVAVAPSASGKPEARMESSLRHISMQFPHTVTSS